MASYQEMILKNDGVDPEVFQLMFLSDLIEIEVCHDGEGWVMTSVVNHGMPESEQEFQEIIEGYSVRRNEILSRR